MFLIGNKNIKIFFYVFIVPMLTIVSCRSNRQDTALNAKLRNTIIKNKVSDIRCILAKGVDPNFEDSLGYSPLELAVMYEDTIITKLLLDYHANVNMPTADTLMTPLINAITERRIANIDLLLRHGANPNQTVGKGGSPLILAVVKNDTAIAKRLLKYGANVNYYHKKMGSAILHAIAYGKREMIDLLLQENPNLNVYDSLGKPPILLASRNGDTATICKLLNKGADINHKNIDGTTPLLYAISDNDLTMVKFLLNKGADPNLCNSKHHNTAPVEMAIVANRAECLKVLLPLDTLMKNKIVRNFYINDSRKEGHYRIAEILEETK